MCIFLKAESNPLPNDWVLLGPADNVTFYKAIEDNM